VSQSKPTSDTVSAANVANLFKGPADLKEFRENHLRDTYEAALKTAGSRELTVKEAEEFIRPYESASDILRSEIEKSVHSSKP
jgi:hypothetical protein